MMMTHPRPRMTLLEWLGWPGPHIAQRRAESRGCRAAAEARLEVTYERASRSEDMSAWLNRRSQQNHIAEALNSALDRPRAL